MTDELVDRTAYLNLLEDYTKAKERIAQLEATLREIISLKWSTNAIITAWQIARAAVGEE